MKVKYYVINLERSVDRLGAISKNFDRYEMTFERVKAIDGASISVSDYADFYQNKYFKPLHQNEIACYMSHIACWRKIVHDHVDFGVVLEDDACFDGRLKELLGDMCGLSHGDLIIFHSCIVKLSKSMVPRIVYKKFDNGVEIVKYLSIMANTTGQIISWRAAKKLLQNICISRPVDVDLRFIWEHGVSIFSTYPQIVWFKSKSTTIHASKNRSLSYYLSKWWYQIKFSFHSFLNCVSEHGLLTTLGLSMGMRKDISGR